MFRLKMSWRRLAALGAVGWAAAGALTAFAQTVSSPTATAGSATQLTAQLRALDTPTQPAPVSNDATAANTVAVVTKSDLPATVNNNATRASAIAATPQMATPSEGPPAKPPVTAAATQQTAYQQPQGAASEPAPAPAPGQSGQLFREYETANRAYMAEPLAPAIIPEAVGPPNGVAATCDPDVNCEPGGCNPCRCLHCCEPYFYSDGWYAGAEFLYLRPNFSSPVAAIDESAVVDPVTNASNLTDRTIDFNADYDSTFRMFGGYRWGECSESLEFSYWRVDEGDSFTSPPASASQFFAGMLGNIADAPGETLRSDFNVELNVWDIDYQKRIPVIKGRPSDGGHCCPQWDWAWSLGVRIVDFDLHQNDSILDAAGNVVSLAAVDSQFTGAGPRAGLEGRRYLGEDRRWSAYGTAHWALLLGDHEITATRSEGLTTDHRFDDFIRTVPVSEFEVGVSRQIGCRTLLTTGYQFQVWWEIGQFESKKTTVPSILSFDGPFVRLEHSFGAHSRKKCQ